MPNFTLVFSGSLKTVKPGTGGTKPSIRFSLCKKNYAKEGTEPTFTWVNCIIFDPKPWHVDMLKEGKFVSGFGKFEMRSYETNGEKKTTAEVIVGGFDLDGPKPDDSVVYSKPAPAARAPIIDSGNDESVPF